MLKKLTNIINRFAIVFAAIIILILWQLLSMSDLIPAYMLPSPVQIIQAGIGDAALLFHHGIYTLTEALLGLLIGIIGGFSIALLMDKNELLQRLLYPLLVLTQTIPTIAIAPLLVLWMGYGLAPKIFLIFLTCFFPIANGFFNGFQNADRDSIQLLKSMGASEQQIFTQIKFPSSLPQFFSGLRIASAYSLVGAVVAEWLGGNQGLGVYMTRARKSFSFDRMFAVIIIIAILSQLLMKLVIYIEKKSMPWQKYMQAKE